MKISEGTIRRIMGEQKKYKVEGTFFSTPDKIHQYPKHVRDINSFD
jgi:peptidoglycan/xylan/chitin deacetylase (PgdA/CDA1 family)